MGQSGLSQLHLTRPRGVVSLKVMESWAKPQGNLDAAGTTRRLRAGVIALAVALAIAVVMAKADVSIGYRLLLFLCWRLPQF